MYRASDAIDLNPWSVQSQLGQHSSIQGQTTVHGASTGATSQELSRAAADRSALLQALADRKPARVAKAAKGHRSLLARLRQLAPTNSAA